MASGPDGVRPPAPPVDAVRASRVHTAARFAEGVDRFMWETYRRPLADTDAVEKVIAAAEAGVAEGPDLAAALLLVQSALLDLDRLAWRVMRVVAQEGMTDETVAAVLDLPSAEAARRYAEWLRERAAHPVDEIDLSTPGHGRKSARAGTRSADGGGAEKAGSGRGAGTEVSGAGTESREFRSEPPEFGTAAPGFRTDRGLGTDDGLGTDEAFGTDDRFGTDDGLATDGGLGFRVR
ncbi:hypothetical protein [Actinomadura gamaensis]|uniref:DNA-directed RNA polymerase specialized sigma24 family protein n=1 Tax=Actinomadura gamaensis TaxID=1763541 RepID=A0ABV9U4R5_9ACTN